MKKLLLLLCFIPFSVKALSLDCPSVVSIGEEFSCMISEDSYIGVSANISLGNAFNYSRLKSNWSSYYSGNNGFNVKKNGDNNFSGELFLNVKVNANSSTYNVELNNVEAVNSSYGHVSLDNISKEISVISDDNTLSNLEISSCTLKPKFNKNILKYEVSTTLDNVNINAVASNANSKISGDIGNRILNIGANVFYIKVTSEKGSLRVYQVIVIRNVSNNNTKVINNASLKSLVVNNQEIKLNSNQFLYQLDVESDVDKLDIKSIANDGETVISVEGADNLAYGENNVIIKLRAKDGTTVQYVLLVNRKENLNVLKNDIGEVADKDIDESSNVVTKLRIPIIVLFIVFVLIIILLKYENKKIKSK